MSRKDVEKMVAEYCQLLFRGKSVAELAIWLNTYDECMKLFPHELAVIIAQYVKYDYTLDWPPAPLFYRYLPPLSAIPLIEN